VARTYSAQEIAARGFAFGFEPLEAIRLKGTPGPVPLFRMTRGRAPRSARP
jgi:class 3 adenylate cyclase